MTTLVVAATKDEAAAHRGRPDSVVLTLRQIRLGGLRGRSFGGALLTPAVVDQATDRDREEIALTLLASSGRP